ncbi:MAG: hypothetical protein WD767_14380 [Alphaproteobacteria bacterium]
MSGIDKNRLNSFGHKIGDVGFSVTKVQNLAALADEIAGDMMVARDGMLDAQRENICALLAGIEAITKDTIEKLERLELEIKGMEPRDVPQ